MPELPDVTIYVEALHVRIVDQVIRRLRVVNPFVLRSVAPAPATFEDRAVTSVRRLGKRIIISVEGDHHLVIHLMIAGRLRWLAPGKKPPGKLGLAALEFDTGSLWLTEAGTTRRASIHLVAESTELAAFDRGGLEVLDADPVSFAERLGMENHTLKRALTDPRLFSGIGNAYADEILHRARLSPLIWTSRLSGDEIGRLYRAVRETLREWTDRLRLEAGAGFPEKVTAFRDGMAVHGRYGQPCPDCSAPVQRIRYADNETNYCARCQTGGRLLADRALSRLLKDDWPRSLDEL